MGKKISTNIIMSQCHPLVRFDQRSPGGSKEERVQRCFATHLKGKLRHYLVHFAFTLSNFGVILIFRCNKLLIQHLLYF